MCVACLVRDCGTAVAVPFSRWLRYRVISYWILYGHVGTAVGILKFRRSFTLQYPDILIGTKHFIRPILGKRSCEIALAKSMNSAWFQFSSLGVSEKTAQNTWQINPSVTQIDQFTKTYRLLSTADKRKLQCEPFTNYFWSYLPHKWSWRKTRVLLRSPCWYGWESEIFSIRITTLPQNRNEGMETSAFQIRHDQKQTVTRLTLAFQMSTISSLF